MMSPLNAMIKHPLLQRVFSMFVLEALVLTFMTTPLVMWVRSAALHHKHREKHASQGETPPDMS